MVNIELKIPEEWFAAEVTGSDYIPRERKEKRENHQKRQ